MSRPNLALIGKARSGKDTIASYLCEAHGYTRVAFADPVREAALKLDPIVSYTWHGDQVVLQRLSRIVSDIGWERAKQVPEVRRVLQCVGQGVRDLDPEFWVRIGLRTAEAVAGPVVFTDVRYQNEHNELLWRNYYTVRVVRADGGLSGEAGKHSSETELDRAGTWHTIFNDRDVPALYAEVDAVLGAV